MNEKGPDFLCIGAQASGTSWFYQQLKKRPDFAFPNQKEIHYFDRKQPRHKPSGLVYRTTDIFKSSDSTLDGFKLMLNMSLRKLRKSIHGDPRDFNRVGLRKEEKQTPESDTAYLSMFETTRITGDVTPAYATLSDEEVAHMAELLPGARIFFLIRNPIDRNWSAYRKKTKKPNFKKFSVLEMKYFFNQEGVEKRTNYIETIDRYSRYFGAENLRIGFYDAIIDQPDRLLEEIVEFLGGDTGTEVRRKRAQQQINVSPKEEMPAEIRSFLTEKYRPLMEELSARYGSYATRWLNDIEEVESRVDQLPATVAC